MRTITQTDFGKPVENGEPCEWNFTMRKLYQIAGGEAKAWEAYFDPGGMDPVVRGCFEAALQPQSRTNAVMLRAFLKRLGQ